MALIDHHSSAIAEEQNDTSLRGRAAALALLVGCHFMLNVDTAIIEVALPSIKRELGFSLSELSWVANAYALTFGGFLLLGGRIGDLFGRRRMLVLGLLLFASASVLGGVATTAAVMVLARGLQGVAAAVISPTALSLVMVVYPDRTPKQVAQRNKALAVLGAVAATGGAAGYFAGGLLCDTLGWPSIFLVNVPIALAAAVWAPRLLPAGGQRSAGGRFGLGSALMVSAGMTLLVYVLTDTSGNDWWTPRTLVLSGLAVVLLSAFLFVQRSTANPLLPLRIFRQRSLLGANVVAALINTAIGPVIFFLSLYTQQVLGESAFASGLAIMPLIVMVTVSSSIAGGCLRRFSQRTVMSVGLVLFGCGLLWLGQISGGHYADQLLGPECLIGLGGGLVFVTFTVSGTAGLAERDSGAASGVLTTSQKIGASVGLAVLTRIAAASTGAVAPGAQPSGAALTAGYSTAILAAAVPVALALAATLAWISGRRSLKTPELPSITAGAEGL